ncbi:MAG: peptidase T [Spirochaetaceae bacterium]|jgi:tripeptide aminopeptidase|nr:peptidase T [Spirochaetaceae bacterium]
MDLREKECAAGLIDRFMRYVKICTTSNGYSSATPSTEEQWELAKLLVEELKSIGIDDIELTSACYVIARVPSNSAHDLPAIGFLAHIDTSPDVNGKNVTPILEEYNGLAIQLKEGVVLDPASDSDLAAHKGKSIIHTDGTSLLGADDKAGIAEIMTALAYLLAHPEIKRPPLEIIFSPDEETGNGLAELPFDKLKSKFCYTLDGGPSPEIEAECFNAYSAVVQFYGNVIHPGSARGKLTNAAVMAAYFASLIPRSESPEATDGYYGYYCVTKIEGAQEKAHIELLIRDFEQEGITRRLTALVSFARATEAAFPGGKIKIETKSSYFNMKEKINAEPAVMEKLIAACRNTGIEPVLKPIRGGTDGSRLTELGIPTPNIFTGARNFHSRKEWASLDEMLAAVRLIVELTKLWADAA